MSYDITIKRGDTRNAIKAILKDSSGNPVNLENGGYISIRILGDLG